MPARRTRAHVREDAWKPVRPVPWPATGDPHLDLLRSAVEAHLYPYGDVCATPSRPISDYQLRLLDEGRERGMSDAEVSRFLSANLSPGMQTVYARSSGTLEPVGTVVLSGSFGPADPMGRRTFMHWIEVRGCEENAAGPAAVRWEGGPAYAAFRRAFGVPWRQEAEAPRRTQWESGQALRF